MSDSGADLKQKLQTADELHAVVRTMKAMAASSIGQYERAVRALVDYFGAVQLALGESLRQLAPAATPSTLTAHQHPRVNAIVYGSDQGLVGQFNDIIADHAIRVLTALPTTASVWTVGERVHARLQDADFTIKALHTVPTNVPAISSLVDSLQLETDAHTVKGGDDVLYVFHNRMRSSTAYEPIGIQMLPLDALWRNQLIGIRWPIKSPREILGGAPPSDGYSKYTHLRHLQRR